MKKNINAKSDSYCDATLSIIIGKKIQAKTQTLAAQEVDEETELGNGCSRPREGI